VGQKSYGKGSVQELIELSDNTSVKITVARWLTPNGEQINEKGINPDIEVELTDEDYEQNRDPQLDKALEILK
jgi:carboxyl-terminal processing protease